MQKKRKLYRKPERPKLRTWFPAKRPAWINMEPSKLGTVSGVFFAWVALVVLAFRQGFGTPGDMLQVVLWVVATFVISYAATGLLAWYILYVVNHELPEEEEARRQYIEEDVGQPEDEATKDTGTAVGPGTPRPPEERE